MQATQLPAGDPGVHFLRILVKHGMLPTSEHPMKTLN